MSQSNHLQRGTLAGGDPSIDNQLSAHFLGAHPSDIINNDSDASLPIRIGDQQHGGVKPSRATLGRTVTQGQIFSGMSTL